MDLQVDANDDLDLNGGELALVRDADAIGQHVRIRLQTWLGETPYNVAAGVPYVQVIFDPNTTDLARRFILQQQILATPGVTGVEFDSVSVNTQSRVLAISGRATCQDGPVEFNVTIGQP
jgi:hypothetical protein